MSDRSATGGVALLGGSFNPLHVGHLRLAVEIHEAFGERVGRVEFLPAAHPPHKRETHVLPFSVRTDLIREAVAPYPWLSCNPVEGLRESPSYTWETLGLLREREPGRELFFVLGSRDYTLLPEWFHGRELPARCTLVVAPRGFYRAEDFARDTRAMWPGAYETEPVTGDGVALRVPLPASADTEQAEGKTAIGGREGTVLFQPLPWLEVSSSLIRERWLAGRCIDYLVPAGVLRMLQDRRGEIRRLWT